MSSSIEQSSPEPAPAVRPDVVELMKRNGALFQTAKAVRAAVMNFSLPIPRFLGVAIAAIFVAIRSVYYFCLRVFLAEPIFRGYCKQMGKRVHTDIYVPWISGRGDIAVGDDVLLDGQVLITFAARYSDCPQLSVGDRTHIGHNCVLVIGKEIEIGTDCLIASGTIIFDSSGHPTDPAARLAGLPPSDDAVRPIKIGNNVWIGKNAMIFPGVTIGDGSVVSAGSIVMRDVPPNTLVAGNPARPSLQLGDPAAGAAG